MTRACSRAAVAAATLVCVQTVSAFFPPPAPPATVYYGTLTAAEEAQVQAWGVAYWNKVENGVASTMTFSNPAMNSHLFNPFRGTRATLESLKLINANDCDVAIIEADTSGFDGATTAKRQALKDAMTAAKFATDPVTNPNGTGEHITKILDAGTTGEFVTYSEGGKLVSEKLPLDVLVASGADGDFASNLSVQTVDAVNAIVVAAPGYASSATGETEAQKALNSGVSRTDQVQSHLETLLHDLGVQGAFVSHLDAAFGVYGSLPCLLVQFSDSFILVDGVNGGVTGPFKNGSPVAAESLLSAHCEYAAGTGVKAYSQMGCQQLVAAIPHLTPPSPTLPGTAVPPTWVPVPGRGTTWVCSSMVPAWGPSTCVCTRREWQWIVPCPAWWPITEPTIIDARFTCTFAGTCPVIPPLTGTAPCAPPGTGSPIYWY